MEYAHLGRSDLEVSRVGFGCWAIGGHGWGPVDDRGSIAAIRRALELGITLFDTADVYGFGHSERLLAMALGPERHRVVIATKFGMRWGQGRTWRDVSPQVVVTAVEESLRRLELDCIPLYQVHWPDGVTPIDYTMEALVRCQEVGKIRWIGCSNFGPEQLRQAAAFGPMVAVQAPYNLLDRGIEQTVLPEARRLSLGVLAYSPLAQGLLSGSCGDPVSFSEEDVRSRSRYFQGPLYHAGLGTARELAEIGSGYGKRSAQVAIRWLLDQRGVTTALTGIKSVAQVEENAAVDWALAPADREAIGGLALEAVSRGE